MPTYSDRYQIIEEMKDRYPITWLTKMAKLERSGYYKWLKNGKVSLRKHNDIVLKEQILAIHQTHKMYGYPRMKIALWDKGFLVNHKKVYRLMSELGIQSIIRKKRRVWGNRLSRVFDNVLERQFKERVENEVLVTDITYLPTKNGFLYLSAVQDLYNNEIVAWRISKRNDLELVMDTLQELTAKRNVYRSIIHSDQGYQYTSIKYHQTVEQLGMIGSHSRKGNCHDNACIESFFSHFKSECLYLLHDYSEETVRQAVEQYIYFYNYQRFQKRLNHLAPIEYRHQMAA
ncbi:Integrase core domain protein [Solibacillus isronensis B3W22]|uniref:Integrase core domain protein n=1 Tax=Solibacillus isronensis B3W22 TaxID=1224748 RepID=K1KQC1_9BACL|nr:IS3 family transposase [Solibacillus isronensis]AMO87363.1 integrase [Solibacillus silvestris]EKB44696.1 Integrase core domain protein [Solibacillus isronensis B3W22]